MTNSENWYTPERLAAVNGAAHRAVCNFIIEGHEEWAGLGAPTRQEQRTHSSSTRTVTNG